MMKADIVLQRVQYNDTKMEDHMFFEKSSSGAQVAAVIHLARKSQETSVEHKVNLDLEMTRARQSPVCRITSSAGVIWYCGFSEITAAIMAALARACVLLRELLILCHIDSKTVTDLSTPRQRPIRF